MCCHKPQKIVPAEKLENLCGGEERKTNKNNNYFDLFFSGKIPISNKVGRNFHAEFIFVRDLLVGCF